MAGLVTPMALRVAVTLGLMDRLRADRAATGSAPVGSAPVGSAAPAAAAPAAAATGSVPVGSVPVGSVPAGSAPVGSAPAGSAAPAAAAPATAAPATGSVPAGSAPVGSATTVDHLAAELDVNPTALELLLGHLATLGVVERTGTGYRTTEFGALLRKDAGNGLHDLLHHDTAAGRADLAFVDLAHSVRTGEPAYPLRYGRGFWADLAEQSRLRDAFDRQMTWRISERIPQFVAAVDWSRFGMIVDVGGGPGDLLAAVLAAHPGVRGHLVDLEVGPALQNFRNLEAQATAGSFFDPLPAGGDAYVLFNILHNWDDEHAHRILARCVEAMPASARLIVIESIRGVEASTEMDLVMLVHFGGRERSVEEFEELAGAHGLRLEGVTEVTGDRSVLEFRKHPI